MQPYMFKERLEVVSQLLQSFELPCKGSEHTMTSVDIYKFNKNHRSPYELAESKVNRYEHSTTSNKRNNEYISPKRISVSLDSKFA